MDELNGLKENVIVGRLIPAGTGSYVNKIRKLAADRDTIALAAQQQAGAIEADETPAPAKATAVSAAATVAGLMRQLQGSGRRRSVERPPAC